MPAKQVRFENVQGSKGFVGRPKLRKIKSNFPKAIKSGVKLRSDLSKWKKLQKPPKEKVAKFEKIKGVRMKVADFDKLTKIHHNPHALGEISVGQKLKSGDVLGMLTTSLITFEYHKMKGEYTKRLRKTRSSAQKAKLKKQWESMQKGAMKSLAVSGIKNVRLKDLDVFTKELRRKRSNYDSIVKIANSAESVSGLVSNKIIPYSGGFLSKVGVIKVDDVISKFPTLDLGFCHNPLEGSYTKHFSHSFSLKVTIKGIPCPKWNDWFRTCTKTYTIASVSFNASVNVGYRVTCCGGAAWGQASAKACGSIILLGEYCAGCTATIVGVVGVGRATGSGSSCTYGLGLNANLKCTFLGVTVLNVSAPFGWTISAPCPPAILPC